MMTNDVLFVSIICSRLCQGLKEIVQTESGRQPSLKDPPSLLLLSEV